MFLSTLVEGLEVKSIITDVDIRYLEIIKELDIHNKDAPFTS